MIANHKGEIPFVILILPFLAGITVGLNFGSAACLPFLAVALAVLILAFSLLNINYSRLNLHKYQWIGGTLVTAILLLAGWTSMVACNELNNGNHFSKHSAQSLICKITNEPAVKNGLVRFTADVMERVADNKQAATTGTILIAIKDSAAFNLYYGDELLIPAKYSITEPPYNPGEFNYKKYLANQNIYYQEFLFPKQYHVLAHNQGNALIAYSLRLRQRLVEKLKRNMRDTSAIAVASTLILGDKADLSNDVLQAYSKTGTVHVLSVSGAHVAIIYLLLNLALSFLNRYKYGRLIKAILIISLVWYYSLLTGFSPAVCRAAVMISMVIVGKTFSRYINTLNILAISAFGLLLYNPLFITDVGFQLSYLAVTGLIVFQPIVYKWLQFKNKWADKLWALCSVSIAAQVITFPLSAFYFHQFPVYFLISNLFIIIPVEVIMYVGILYLLLPQIPVISQALAYVLEQAIILMNKGLAIMEYTPFASINKIWLTTAEYLLAYVIIVCGFYFLFDKKKWLLKLSLAAILLLSISMSCKRIAAYQADGLTILNLKKHTGLVFKNGDKAVVLTDLKADDKSFRYSVQPCLDSNKIGGAALYNLTDNVTTPYLLKKGNLIQYKNKLILILDDHLKIKQTAYKIKINYIYVTGNPHTPLSIINNNFDYQTLIIDGSNSDYLIKNLVKQAQNTHVDYWLLKRNKSLLISSN